MPESHNELVLIAPLSGLLAPLSQVPDPVFSSGMLGPGLAIDPTSAELLAPCDGRITQLARTGHALTLTAANGAQILLHIGIDTVKLRGQGFEPCVAENDLVQAGDVLIRFDADRIAATAPSLMTMLVLGNGEDFSVAKSVGPAVVQAGRGEVLRICPKSAESAAPPAPPALQAFAPASIRRSFALACPGGLHARPAARAMAVAKAFDADVLLHYQGRQARMSSLVELLNLGAGESATLELVAGGVDAAEAASAVIAELQRQAAGEADTLPGTPDAGRTQPALAGHGPVVAAPGIAVGSLFWWSPAEFEPAEAGQGLEHERQALSQALEQAHAQLAQAIAQAERQGATGEAGIFAVHRALLEDRTLQLQVDRLIAAGKSAGFAWRQAMRDQAAALSALDEQRLAERASDMRDLEQRVLRCLMAEPGQPGQEALRLPEGEASVVLAAHEFMPSDLIGLDASRVVALLMAGGGPTSHAAIIARQLGLPCLVAVGSGLGQAAGGTEVIVDADNGRLDLLPDAAALSSARARVQQRQLRREVEREAAHAPAVTRDGQRIEVAANIGSLEDARQAVAHGADAVGLLRTEMLFMSHRHAPTIAEHAQTCQAIVDALGGRSAIIRTLDIGADKQVGYLSLPHEPNPALGLRGIRLARWSPQLLEDQLQGLLSLRTPGPLRILLPMVTEVGELIALREHILRLAKSMRGAQPVELGVMVEVPSAALLADQLAEHADFLSIGTNDLTQYALAMDRCQPELADRLDGLHPAVLRLIEATVRGAARHKRWVGVCGALAGDLLAVPILVGLGVAELSVDAGLVPGVKARLRSLSQDECREQVQSLLNLPSAQAVRAQSRQRWPS
ncbi:phosphoenolpyruvate--protein phosphotransferase [Comamonas composti]|uniref:phosphoenolpyruvate--protein phosphotransferase n=1 Tax=Comamonas composti TaxID=408558 RepID=UPI00041E6469|nr:phosphoenolpyruvate--protein phosphotransferase [Comamonas composti]